MKIRNMVQKAQGARGVRVAASAGFIMGAVALLLVLAAVFTGCTTVSMLADDAFGSAVDRRVAAKTGELDGTSFGFGDGSLMMMPPGAGFQIVYAQTTVFSAGAISPDDFSPGEGVRWRLTWEEAEEPQNGDVVESEQALLERNANGEWWYISLSSESSKMEYEYFINPDDVVTQLVYQDSEMTASRTVEVSIPLDRADDQDGGVTGGEESLYEQISQDSSGSYTVTRATETVTVPAGTFTAKKVAVTGTDEETGTKVDGAWWFADQVPGGVVQYEFITEEDGRYMGRLLAVRRDYRRRL